MRSWIAVLLERLGLSADSRGKLLVNVVSWALTGLAGLVGTLAIGALTRAWRARRRAPADPKEVEYLRKLRQTVLAMGHQWHQSPLRPVHPIPMTAHTSTRTWKQRMRRRAARLRARLFRYNTSDYSRNPLLAGDIELSLRAGFGRRVKIRDLARELRKFSRIVVLGDPGSGKSVCLRQAAHDIAAAGEAGHGPPAIPIIVDMGAYDGWEDPVRRVPQSVLSFLAEQLRSEPSIRQSPTEHPYLAVADRLESLLRQGRLVCVLDALDEMPQDSYQERYRELRQFMVHWEEPGNRFIYSCRTLDYDPSFKVDEIIIDPFDRARIEAFLHAHVPTVAEALLQPIIEDPALEEMVGNPFYLQALAFLNEDAREGIADAGQANIFVPKTRGELVRRFVEKLLARESDKKQDERLSEIPSGPEELRRFLQDLAFALQARTKGGTSVLATELADVQRRHPDWRRLLWVAGRARVLGKRGAMDEPPAKTSPAMPPVPQRIEFVHHRLEEFFAAEELARLLESGAPVEEYIEDIWWQETVILASSVVADPRPVLAQMLARRPDVDRWSRDIVRLAVTPVPDRGGGAARTSQEGAGIVASAPEWRGRLLDLPFVVVLLRAFKQLLAEFKADAPERAPLIPARTEGERLSRRRGLFVAAEALGQLPRETAPAHIRSVNENLGRLAQDGNSLHKVRALRAMRFVADEDCLPTIEKALQDPSAWVAATAVRVMFRLNLTGQRSRSLVWRTIRRSFTHAMKVRWFVSGLTEMVRGFAPRRRSRDEDGSIHLLSLVRVLVSGLRKERGGRAFALAALALSAVVVGWMGVAALAFGAVFLAMLGVFVPGFFAVGIGGAPLVSRLSPRALSWRSLAALATLDYATIAVWMGSVGPEAVAMRSARLAVLAGCGLGLFVVLGYLVRGLRMGEEIRAVGRAGLLAYAACRLGLLSAPGLVLTTIGAAHLLWVALRVRRKLPAGLATVRGMIPGLTPVLTGLGTLVLLAALGWSLLYLLAILALVGVGFGLAATMKWTVALARLAVISRARASFRSIPDYVDYIVEIARDPLEPVMGRVQATLRLVESPISDPTTIQHLMDAADDEALPLSVRDAIHQVVDAADRRIQRGQTEVHQRQAAPPGPIAAPRSTTTPGRFFRPSVALCLVVGAATALLLARRWPAHFGWQLRDGVVVGLEAWAAAAALVLGLATLGRRSAWRAGAMAAGFALLFLAASRPIQLALQADNNVVTVTWIGADLSLILATSAAVLSALLGGLVGVACYRLDSDDGFQSSRGGAGGLAVSALALVLVSLGASPPVLDLFDRHHGPLPAVARSGPDELTVVAPPGDGRVMRVALVATGARGERPAIADTFPLVKTSGPWWTHRPAPVIPLEQRLERGVLEGEVWLARRQAAFEARQNIGGCLRVRALERDGVTLGIDRACLRPGRHEVLLMVYSRSRSAAVWTAAHVDVFAERPPMTEARRLLAHMVSMYVVSRWGPAL